MYSRVHTLPMESVAAPTPALTGTWDIIIVIVIGIVIIIIVVVVVVIIIIIIIIIIIGMPHGGALPFLSPAATGLCFVPFSRPRSDQGSEGAGQSLAARFVEDVLQASSRFPGEAQSYPSILSLGPSLRRNMQHC